MKVLLRIVLLAVFLLSACSAPAALTVPTLTPAPTAAATVTAATAAAATAAAATAAPSPTPYREPTPTAAALPTRVTRERTSPERKSLLEQYLPRGVPVAETEHFVFHAQDGYFPVEMEWWLAEAETVYDYVSQRLGVTGQSKVQLAFMPPETRACPVRGMAAKETPPTVLIYADEQSPRAYLLVVLAHELGHAIPFEGFPGGLPDNLALTEGLATWASGKYWAGWNQVPGLDDLVRGYIRDGLYEPLHENVVMEGIYPWQNKGSGATQNGGGAIQNGGAIGDGDDCLARRDQLYSQWGAFLGYLVDTYGWEKAHLLFAAPSDLGENGRVIEFPAHYEGVYGKTLNQLEAEWLAHLRRPALQTAQRLPSLRFYPQS